MNAQSMKKHLVTGFILLLPLVLTYWIISFLIDLLTGPFLEFTEQLLELLGFQKGSTFLFLPGDLVLSFLSKLLIIVFLLLVITSVGAVARYLFFRTFLKVGDALLRKIPLISSIYKTSHELITTIFSEQRAFTTVVLVPYPHASARAIGLLTRSEPILDGRVTVFIPTTPNPTSGYLILFKQEDIQPIEMKVDEALRIIVSCGVLLEENAYFKKIDHA